MTTASTEIGTLLADLVDGVPAEVGSGTGGVHTLDALRRLSARASQPPEPDDRKALTALCRKLGVAGRVWEAYDPAWKRPASRTPLTSEGYALLAGVLVAHADSAGRGDDGPGWALKLLNAAFSAIDLARAGGDTDFLRELDAVADRTLGRLLPAP